MNIEQARNVFNFLKTNNAWNEAFSINEYKRHLTHCLDDKSRLRALLHMVANTQARPRIDHLSHFWQHFESYNWGNGPLPLTSLTEFLERPREKNVKIPTQTWERLYSALCKQPGWGRKTSALFIKCLIQIHRSKEEQLHFIVDARYFNNQISTADTLYLPVDSVITHIFRAAGWNNNKLDFKSINKFLLVDLKCCPEDILIWDDLWFWGFFSQDSRESDRITSWNPQKYWCQPSTEKSEGTIKSMKILCEEFMSLL